MINSLNNSDRKNFSILIFILIQCQNLEDNEIISFNAYYILYSLK